MASFDWLAIYGAVLATLLGVLQMMESRRASRSLRVKWYDVEYDTGGELWGAITNVSANTIYINELFLGSSYRPWRKPWLEQGFEAIGVNMVEPESGNRSFKGLLKPGDLVEFTTHVSELEKYGQLPDVKKGFFRRHVLWIDHSGANAKQYVKVPQLPLQKCKA